MQKRGRIFTLLLSAAVILAMMPGAAFAEETGMEQGDVPAAEEPEILHGFVTDDNGTLYYDENGEKVTGWQDIGEHRYHFDSDGYMSTGLVPIDKYFYYFNPSSKEETFGAMETGWKTIDGKKYYFSSKNEGKAFTGWHTLGDYKYYFSKTKAYAFTGWHTIGSYTYYFSSTGKMQKSKMISKNKYVNSKGHLVKKSRIYYAQVAGLTSLKSSLKKKVGGYRGTWCIYVKNLDTNRYMVINNKSMHPASMIKLYNMGCTYERIKKGYLKKTTTVKSNLRSMITVSSNDGYNYLLKRIGGGSYSKGRTRLNSFCDNHGYSSTTCGGTLAPTRYSSYHKGYTRSTVKNCGHILEDIYRGTLVSESASKEMLSLLKAQKRKNKIPAGLPSGVKTANKTGEVGSEQHDSAIVFSNDADYIIVVMTKGDPSAISHIRSVSRTVYNYFN